MKKMSTKQPELYALYVMSIFYTTCVGLQNKEAKSSPRGQLSLIGELKPGISGDDSFSVIDSSYRNQDGQKTS